jgi:exonuclease III
MIGTTWNIRSLAKPGRKKAIADFIQTHRVDFICLQETKREIIETSYLDFIYGNFPFVWNYLPAKNTAGGILVGFRDDIF